MRVGVIQSCYLPWRGYFDFIASVDIFVIYDDVQYSKNSWRNRNRLKTRSGLKWLTVPVHANLKTAVDEVPIAQQPKRWQDTHRAAIKDCLEFAPYFQDVVQLWEYCVSHNDTLLSQLNVRLIKAICTYMQINTPMVNSRNYHLQGHKTERLIDLLKKLGATTYLSGPSACEYLDENLFRQNGIYLEYKNYDYLPYPQLHGNFEGSVTVLDLIANCGPNSLKYMKSMSPDKIIVP